MDDEDTLEINVDSLVGQLKQSNKECRDIQKRAKEPDIALHSDELEDFVVSKTATLITRVQDTLENTKLVVDQAPDPESIEAFAELVKASSSSLEILNKIIIQRKKTETSIKLKEMDIIKDQDPQNTGAKGLKMGREQVLAFLAGDVVDAEEVKTEDPDSTDSSEQK